MVHGIFNKLNALKQLPFFRSYLQGKVNHATLAKDLDAFTEQLKKGIEDPSILETIRFTDEDIEAIKKGIAYNFSVEAGTAQFFFLKSKSREDVKKLFEPTGMWVSHSTSYENLLTIIKSRHLRDPFGIVMRHGSINSRRQEQDKIMKRFLDGISFDFNCFRHSMYVGEISEPIIIIFPLHKALMPGLVLDFYNTIDGFPEIDLRYDGIYENNVVYSRFKILYNLYVLLNNLEADSKQLPALLDKYRKFVECFGFIKQAYSAAISSYPDINQQHKEFSDKLDEHDISNQLQINPYTLFHLMKKYHTKENITLIMFLGIISMSAYEYANDKKPAVYSSYNPAISRELSVLFRKTPLLTSFPSFYNMELNTSFDFLYYLFHNPAARKKLGLERYNEIIDLTPYDYQKLLEFPKFP